ncbi:hypothetical protein P4U03_28075 [Bacillus mycoides]|uniref:Uncharacterized protein n=1 Tax=Bacillus mycoides TaxID=1405 RepID=A0A1E8BNA4_BACMY|nr:MULTISPECIES: hypothetical protein [Bacillus cereus group]MDM5460207.1 hypothetical protein [Bacillus cereus]MED1270343.1 hypothetical protein [Bacillus mycoides]OFD94481.1 hypothetical protein BWGOE11_26270 [Bacillus mycoides]OFE01200.1 hypothetical protein BWGOE13_24920 [Bacillus mycoides]CAH2465033.1 hypothetical protein ACOSJ1_EBGNOMHC_05279 [Bacillus mycoides KBAB4]
MKKVLLTVMIFTGILSFGVANQSIEQQSAKANLLCLDHGETI